ncbi:competence protein CoiA family protein [Streptomyces hirsutus]|uniref:competence protein CoiA family protein n=1 Tax=Streptomyces hirsutus TaxID=35620 RepID=UPI0036A8B788
MAVVDTRLVQTAVIGTKDSDQPVILPEEPHNLDQFRRHFQDDRFWCGTLLGGCGGELMTKRYEKKVCHFAHYPDHTGTAPMCDRVANGADSADHLFIKRDLTAWFRAQGIRVQAELRNLGTGPGDAVDFWLPTTRQQLRFQLCLQDYRTWYRAEQETSASSGQMDWVFGAEGPISANMVQRQGYALRVKCETHGSDRRVLIGVERADRPVVWSALDDCRLTPGGLVTPVLEESLGDGSAIQRGQGAWLRPATFPLRADQIVFAVDAKAPTPKHSALAAEGRYIITADVKPAGSRIIRAHVSLPDNVPMPTEQYVYRLYGVARLLLTDSDPQDGVQWAVRADGVVQLGGIEAERTGLWRPGVALPQRVRETSDVPVPAQRVAAGQTAAASDRVRSAEPASKSASTKPDPETVARVRKALENFAKRRTPTTWSTLGTVAKLNLVRLSPTERRDLLFAVDRPATPDKPVLSALVRDSGGRPLPDMTTIIRKLGLQPPTDEVILKLWCDRERDRAYHAHSASRVRMLPARLAIGTDGRASEPPATPRPKKRQVTDNSRRAGVLEDGLHELIRAFARGQELLPATSGPQYTRLSKAMKKARARLDAHRAAKAKGAAHADWLNSHSDSLSLHAQFLWQAIRATEDTFVSRPDPVVETPKPLQLPSPSVATEANSSKQSPEEAVAKSPKEAAAEQFYSLVEQFREAQRVLDVDRAEEIYRMAGPLYRTQLSPADQHRNQAIVAEMRTWVGVQQPNRSSALLKRCRHLIHQMREQKDTLSTDGLAALVAEAEALSERATLSHSEQKDLAKWQQHLQTRREAERFASADEPTKDELVAEGRLSRSQILNLASVVRPLLEQTARGRSLTTWGDLRRRLGEGTLPRLHPDDQGEVLVAVDRDTPADEPLLSSLIVVGDGEVHPLYRHVAFSLDRGVPPSDAALRSEWAVDVLRLRALWKHR